MILVWLVSEPIFGFSDTWQTATTIFTFLMVFLIRAVEGATKMHC
ncbi:MAG: low affinity iron permease family protein [Methylobacter sp.]